MLTVSLVLVFVIAVIVGTSIPLGRHIARVFEGRSSLLDPALVPLERGVLRLAGVDAGRQHDWRAYARALLLSNLVMWLAGWAIVTLQHHLPLNPDGIGNMEPTLAFNTISSFATNTNLQHYAGETALSYFSQIFVVTFLQFVTAGTGIAASVALMRAVAGARSAVGNFYVDLARATVRILLPLALALATVLLWQGSPATLDGAATVVTLEGHTQIIARGPVAAMVAIKQLGTNGGGFFGANSAHPFENPTPLTTLLEIWAILAIPMAMVWTFGVLVKRRRLAVMVFAVMLALFVPLLALGLAAEAGRSPEPAGMSVGPVDAAMEGKEVRVGTALTAFWSVSTTATSNGSVAGMHDSLTPLGGLAAMAGMWLNTIFGGVGVGFINMFVFIVVAVFVGGMMIGRTPELLGRKVEAREMKLASLALLWHPLAILVGTAAACYVWSATTGSGSALGWLRNPGPHGFSEMLYEFTSAAANNGSGFEGLGDNTPFWNISTALVMLGSRYVPIIVPLALAGSLSAKPAAPETAGTLAIDSATFGVTLWAVVVILGLLMFMPVAVLGPVAEHLAGG